MSRICFADNLQAVHNLLTMPNKFVIIDSTVARLYPSLAIGESYIVSSNEANKTLATVEDILSRMNSCNRSTTVVAIGGGVVGDIAGFVAAISRRGLSWINVPTTLLAQVDAGIGGKTGVNVGGYKNMAGVFHSPSEVIVDSSFLGTLSDKEWRNGIGEIIKTATLSSKIWDMLMVADLSNHDFVPLIKSCARFKSSVTRSDFRETKGSRKRLNVGHTIAHALEKYDNARQGHGEYVMLGMIIEGHLVSSNVDRDFADKLQAVIEPYRIDVNFDAGEVARIARSDKKNTDKISIVVPTAVAQVEEFMFTEIELARGLERWKSSH